MKKIEPPSQNAKVSTGKVFDVMRPGRAPASATSKPVIVGPQVQDMSVSVNGIGDRRIPPAPAQAPAPDVPRKIEVMSGMRSKPIEVPNEPDTTDVSAPTQPVNTMEVAEQEVDALAAVAIEGANNGETAWEATPLPTLPPDPLLDGTAAPNLTNQGVVVSNHAPSGKGSAVKTVLLVVVVLVLAVAIFDLLLDADIVTIDAVPHTNFLAN